MAHIFILLSKPTQNIPRERHLTGPDSIIKNERNKVLEACSLQCGNAGLGQTVVVTMQSTPVVNVFLSIWFFPNSRWVRTEEQWRSEVNMGDL